MQALRRVWLAALGRRGSPTASSNTLSGHDATPSRLSWRGRVILVVLANTCLALLLSAAALLIYELRAYRVSRIDDLQTQADIIGQATGPALAFDDKKAATENLHMLRLRPQITAAAIYGPNQQLFASYVQSSQADYQLPRQPASEGYAISGQVIELYHTIRQNNEVLGTLYLRTDYDIASRLTDYLLILLGVMAASLALAALITARMQRSITEPILRMAQVVRDVMARRDFSLRAPKTSDDEVGDLVDAFNGMLAEVAARTDDLEQTNHHLSVEMAERKKAEEALRLASRRKDEFLATLAHELRNPLAPISNAVEILHRIENRDPALRQRALDIMARQLRQMVRLIDDLLDVSRVTTGKLVLHKERVDLVRVLHIALEISTPLIDKRGHALQLRLPDTPLYLTADATRLAQVFANLLNNAAKYTDAGGTITVTLQRADGGFEIGVEDTGVGIAPEMLRSIFEMFVQAADHPLEHGRAGLGVGLSLARQLIALHGGTLRVRSEGIGLGSEFTVWLPNDDSAAEEPPDLEPILEMPEQAEQPLRILVADDNVDFATSLASILESLGHSVSVTHDGASAIALAPDLRPDLVFLDIGMPGQNGYEVATYLRQLPQTAHCPIVAVTGWGQEQDRQRSRACGMQYHLVKPARIEQLLAILRQAQRDLTQQQ